jgi:hypothetical protein
VYRLESPSEGQTPEIAAPEALYRPKCLQCVFGGNESGADLARRLFKASGHVHNVAVKNDRAPIFAHLTGNYLAEVNRCAKLGLRIEVSAKGVTESGERGSHVKEASQRTHFAAAFGFLPRDYDLVAHVLVNLAPPGGNRFGERSEHTRQEAVYLKRAEPLRESSRANHVHEEKEALFGVWPVVPTGQERAKGPKADEPGSLKDHNKDQGNGHREAQGPPQSTGIRFHRDAQEVLARTKSDNCRRGEGVDDHFKDEQKAERN